MIPKKIKEVAVAEVNLEDAKIKYKGEWLSIEDLTGEIKQKMEAGDMKITNLAAALEKLKTTLENAHELEIKIVLPREDYEKLKALGGGDDRACVRKAIMAFIEGGGQAESAPTAAPESKEKKKSIIQCAKADRDRVLLLRHQPYIEVGRRGRTTSHGSLSGLDGP